MTWGTGFAEAMRLFDARSRDDVPVAAFRCRQAGGFAVLGGELTAPARDRPVLSAAFELAPVRESLWRPGFWSDTLAAVFGPPDQQDESEIPPHADASGSVVRYSNWQRDGFAIGVSVYGGLRTVPGGRSAGKLWLSWSEERAAAPFVATWRERCAWLEGCAGRLSRIERFTTEDASYPSFGSNTDDPTAALAPAAAERRAARLALHRAEILLTPRAIAETLTPRRFALWTSEADRVWCVSTRWDSIANPIGAPVRIEWSEIAAAKGPGYADLRIGDLWLRSGERSRAIADAAAWLRALPGVTVQHHEGYNA